jgi:hypothetical protein
MLCHRLAQNISQLYQAKNKKKKKRLLLYDFDDWFENIFMVPIFSD